MTINDINTKISQLTGADTSTSGYPSATRLIDINNWYHKIVSTMIYGSQDESDFDDQRNTTYPIKTVPLVAAQRDYSIPVSEKVVGIKRVDISYDGGTTWNRATPLDSNEIIDGIGRFSDTTAENTLDGNFSKSSPKYDTKYNALFIYPRADATDVANGALMKVEWQREITEITSGDVSTGTLVPGFDSAFHPILAYGPAFEYATVNNLPSAKSFFAILQDYELRLNKVYGSKQKDRDLQLAGSFENYK